MENAVNYLIAHPVLFVIAIIVALMVIFSSLKKLLKLAMTAVAVLVLYAAYVHFTGGDVHEAFFRIEQAFNNVLHFFGGFFTRMLEFFRLTSKP
ncbi:MAG: hypothetical protein HGB20_05325 [Chlorobiaceae bacterium]|nr:hypothetical protein [Chlorobiaceae bacterium]